MVFNFRNRKLLSLTQPRCQLSGCPQVLRLVAVRLSIRTEWNCLESPSCLWWVISPLGLRRIVLFLPAISADLLQFTSLPAGPLLSCSFLPGTIPVRLVPKALPLEALWAWGGYSAVHHGQPLEIKYDTSPFWMVLCLFPSRSFFLFIFWTWMATSCDDSGSLFVFCPVPKFHNSC